MNYFQLLSVNSFIIVFDSPSFRDEVLRTSHHWFGKHLISIAAWKPFFVPSWSSSKLIPFWFGLPKIPFEFMDPDVLEKFGNTIGTFLTSKMDFVEGEVLVKICVLINPNNVCPRTCNIKSHDGIWHQSIEKLDTKLLKSPLLLDAPLLMDFKKNQQVVGSVPKSLNKDSLSAGPSVEGCGKCIFT